jgi:hypothetical protein
MAPEKREHERDSFSQTIYYALEPRISGSVFSGLMVNYSFSGMCMETHYPLRDGQEIAIHSVLFAGVMPAVVRWTKRDAGAAFRVGLEFRK